MKNKVLYILVALCAGFSAQAQQVVITEYSVKLKSLSEAQVESLDHLINGEQGSLYVDDDKPEIYQKMGNMPKTMFINKATDLNLLTGTYLDKLSAIEVIHVVWNNPEPFDIPSNALSKLSKLNYIFVSSNQELSKQIIESNLPSLLKKVRSFANLEILYSGVEQVQ